MCPHAIGCLARNQFQPVTVYAVILGACLYPAAQAQTKNGFDLSKTSIDVSKILSGGPPRDGIPAIDQPKYLPAKRVDYLRDDDIVIGLVRGDRTRAYPLRILVWHEIVNDMLGDEAVAVTYCPLCGTAMVFSRRFEGKVRRFGVSGLLYQSDVLMYDREAESLWSQLAMQAVSGPDVGRKLTWLPSKHMTWRAWREAYPQSQVLSMDTGHRRNYQGKAYAAYFASERTMFPVPHTRRELSNKTWVIGTVIDGQAKAYPVDDLPAQQVIKDRVGNQQITLRFDAVSRFPQMTGPDGEQIPVVMVFWFAWQAFYPETELWQP